MSMSVFPRQASSREKTRSIAWFLFFLVVFLAQIWPLYILGNRFSPQILGMPFSLFWIVLWTVIGFIGLVVKYQGEYGGKK